MSARAAKEALGDGAEDLPETDAEGMLWAPVSAGLMATRLTFAVASATCMRDLAAEATLTLMLGS
eukprot:1327583-Rhodomonas_salina.3